MHVICSRLRLILQPHQYAVGTSFDQIIELYQFDKELRSLIFTAIQDVEIALRSRIIHHFSMSHGTFWFLNRNMFKDKSIFNTTLQKEWNVECAS